MRIKNLTLALLVCSALFFEGCVVDTEESANRALSFDGVDDQVDLGNIYDDLALPVTVSAWVYVDESAPAGYMPLFGTQVGGDKYNGVTFGTSTEPSISIQYGDGQGGNNVIYRRSKVAVIESIKGRWVNVTGIMRSGTDMDLYIDGIEVDGTYSGTSQLTMNSNAPGSVAKIGYFLGNGGVKQYFKGKIDELRIWNRSLSETEVIEVAYKRIDASHNGLIGYWNFDEESGAVIDQSVNKFNGTLTGGPTRVESGVPFK